MLLPTTFLDSGKPAFYDRIASNKFSLVQPRIIMHSGPVLGRDSLNNKFRCLLIHGLKDYLINSFSIYCTDYLK